MNPLDKFHELVSTADLYVPSRPLSFALWSNELEDLDKLYCEDMVNRGKLDSVNYCKDDGDIESNTFVNNTLYYERDLSIARNKIYIFRLPFFGMNVSFQHGGEVDFFYKGIRISKTKKEQAEREAKELVGKAFKMYISFIRCWVAKSWIDYESSFNILKHYSENDGIVTIPEFLEARFKESLNPKLIPHFGIATAIKANNIMEKFLPVVKCLNDGFKYIECPFCSDRNISTGKMTNCSGCGKVFMGE